MFFCILRGGGRSYFFWNASKSTVLIGSLTINRVPSTKCVYLGWRTLSPELDPIILINQASRFQIIKVHVERTEVSEDKEGIEEMELAATNSHSLEAWLSTIEVSSGMTNAEWLSLRSSVEDGFLGCQGKTSLEPVLTTSTISKLQKGNIEKKLSYRPKTELSLAAALIGRRGTSPFIKSLLQDIWFHHIMFP